MKNDKLKSEIEELRERLRLYKIYAKKYEKGYFILIEYWDSIPDEEKPKLDKKLKRLGL